LPGDLPPAAPRFNFWRLQLCCIWFQVDSTVWVGYSSGIIRVFDILRVDPNARQRVLDHICQVF
jgi:hypothetical protein